MIKRQLEPEFKAKVALMAIQGEMTIAEISSKFQVHSTQITKWRKMVMAGIVDIFSKGRRARSSPEGSGLAEELYKEIGKLKVENEWLKKKSVLLLSLSQEGIGNKG